MQFDTRNITNSVWILVASVTQSEYAPPIRPRLMALYKCALID